MIKTAIISVVLTSGLLLTGAALADPLRIATEGAFRPWNFTETNGALAGFEVDLAHDLCRRMQAECTVVAQDWDGIIPGLQQGKYDAILAGMSITDERMKVVDFSVPYAAEPTVFAARKGSPLLDLRIGLDRIDLTTETPSGQEAIHRIGDALKGKTVAVQVSTIQARMMEALFPDVTVKVYDRLDSAVLDLGAGRVDAVLAVRSAVDAAGGEAHELVTFGPAFSRGILGRGVAVAVKRGRTALVDRFSDAIKAAIVDGTVASLSKDWFGFDVSVR